MPTGNLPAEGKALFEKVYESAKKSSTCKDAGDRMDECAARVAWTAVKNAGWHKGGDGQWVKSADLEEFSLTIKKAVFDEPTQEMRWSADTSDTDDDSYGDNMTMELFEDFVDRIKKNELAPEPFRSDFWQGGMPYLSVSHYPDFNGKGVPGPVTHTFIDGKFLKARGKYDDTPLGRACFKSVCRSLYPKEEDKSIQEKVRISIAFLDWMHQHKSNNFIFERKDINDFCPECLRELMNGEYKGRRFLKGQLVHYAQTTVPVNKRTDITAEVDRAMAKTRKEDAAAIVGEELAEELEKEAKLVGKSDALIVKADEEAEVEKATSEAEPSKANPEDAKYQDCMDDATGQLDQDCVKMHKQQEGKSEAVEEIFVEEAVMRKEGGCSHPSSHYLVVGDASQVTTWHLRYKNCSGEVDNRLLGAAKAALTSPGGHRGNKYEGPDKSSAISKLKGLYKKQGLDWEAKSDVEFEDEIWDALAELKSMLTPKEAPVHPLDQAILKLKADYDATVKMEAAADEKLQSLQPSLNEFAQTMVGMVKSTSEQPEAKSTEPSDVMKVLAMLTQKMELMNTQIQQMQKPVIQQSMAVPERRAINPALVQQSATSSVSKSETPKLRALIERTT